MRRARDSVSLLQSVEAEPWRHDLYRVLRDLECAHPEMPRIGVAKRPQDEAIRFGQEPSLAFAPSTIAALRPGKQGAPPRLVQQFFGLFGPNGPLPLHLTEFARNRVRHARDGSFVRFCDLIHHRMVSHFYRAWAQAQPTNSYDRPADDRFSVYVGSLVGMGLAETRGRDAASDHQRLFFAGHLGRSAKNAEGLSSMLRHLFKLPVEVEPFAGAWIELPDNDLTRLGHDTAGCVLGHGAVLGGRVWDRQHRIRLRLGPMNADSFEDFLPGQAALARLKALMRQYLGFGLDWDVQLVLEARSVPRAQLGKTTRLGWTSWLGQSAANGARTCDADELILDVERLPGSAPLQQAA